jgi:carboxymethylenebutenolidase
MHVKQVSIATPDGQMPAVLYEPDRSRPQPAIFLLMEAFGVTSHIQDIANRIAQQGYVVLTPDLYYRESAKHTFGYDEVEHAMATMWRLDFGAPIEADLNASLVFLKSYPTVDPTRVGVTGFCLGGGLTFLTACKFATEIAAAAPFYGMVLDEWIDAVNAITVPIYLFFGGADPFIPRDRIEQIEARFKELGKDYSLKLYPDAGHGFFCHERSSYNRAAAEDSWRELTQFFRHHLQPENPAIGSTSTAGSTLLKD